MNVGDKKEFMAIMYAMAENFNAQTTNAGLRIRFDALRQYSIGQVRQACTEVVRSRKFSGMPNVAEIIEKIDGGTKADIAEREAYGVIEQIRRVGAYGTPVFLDKTTCFLMNSIFRWGELCSRPERELKFFIKDFVSAYKNCSQQNPQIEPVKNEKLLEMARGIG